MNSRYMNGAVLAVMAGSIFFAVSPARATLLVSESFDYTATTALTSATLNGGIGWSGSWFGTGNVGPDDQIEAADIVPPSGYQGQAGNQLVLNTDTPSLNVEVVAVRDLASPINLSPASEETLYISFLFRRDDGFNGGGGENSRYFELRNGTDAPVVYAGTTSDEASYVSLIPGYTVFNTGTLGEVSLGVDTLGLIKLVLRPDGQDDEIYLTYLEDGDDLSAEPTSWMVSMFADATGTMGTFSLSQTRFTDLTRYDELRIGTTFADVIGINNVLVGDLDGDGFVGIADLNIVLGAWNQNVSAGDPQAGDPSGDGFVGIEDLNTVLGNWNAGTPPSGNAVPEPATLSLLSLGGLAMLKRRR